MILAVSEGEVDDQIVPMRVMSSESFEVCAGALDEGKDNGYCDYAVAN